MKEKENWEKVPETSQASLCARANDLVTYLYGEASESEAKEFESHIQGCAPCRAELSMFSEVREAIGAWRNEALGLTAFPARVANDAPAVNAAGAANTRKRSAIAALREFFTLSPAWMRTATAFASIAFCVLSVIAVSRLFDEPKFVMIEKPGAGAYDADQTALGIAAKAQRDRAFQQAVPSPITVAAIIPPRKAVPRRTQAAYDTVAGYQKPALRPSGRPFTAQERQQLAEDLRLVPRREEEDSLRLVAGLVDTESN